MNYNSFQELNENPIFADVSVYNRTVMTPQSLPHVVDEAIKAAYEHKGVAIVTIPVDLGFEEIDEQPFSTAHTSQNKCDITRRKRFASCFCLILKKAKNQFFMLVKERETDFRKSKNSQNIFQFLLSLPF